MTTSTMTRELTTINPATEVINTYGIVTKEQRKIVAVM
jgi:hypothetical protein